jgi:hypothetical protein
VFFMRWEMNFYILHTWTSCWLLTAEARVWSLASPCEIFGGNSDTERGFFWVLQSFPKCFIFVLENQLTKARKCSNDAMVFSFCTKRYFMLCSGKRVCEITLNVQCYSMHAAWSFLLNSAVSIIFSIHSSG